MKPDVDVVLWGFLGTLFGDVVPHLQEEYAVGHAAVMALMLSMLVQEHDRGVEVRVLENAELRGLFAEAARTIGDEPLRDRLQQAAATADDGLRIQMLDRANAELRGLLVALHEHVEASDAAWASALEARIWDVIQAGLERRKIDFPVLG